MPLAHQIVIRPSDGRALFNDVRVRRRFTATVVGVGKPFEVLGWGAGDDHGHVLNKGDRRRAGQLSRRIESSLTLGLGLDGGFAPARITPVNDQTHLYRCLPYLIGQHDRHGLRCDPFHEGSSLPDSAGLRVLLPEIPSRLARVAPRFDPRSLLGPLESPPAPDDAAAYAAAAAAVIGQPDLRGTSKLIRLARRAVVELAHDASAGSLRRALCCSQRTLGRIRRMPSPPRGFTQAVRLQARWRNPRNGDVSGGV